MRSVPVNIWLSSHSIGGKHGLQPVHLASRCHSERSDPSSEGIGPQDEESRSAYKKRELRAERNRSGIPRWHETDSPPQREEGQGVMGISFNLKTRGLREPRSGARK